MTMSGVPPVFIAAIGTPSALASISTRLKDSGPRDGKISIDACAIQAAAAGLIDPADQADVAIGARGSRGDGVALGAVAGDHERPVEVRALDGPHENGVPLFGASLPR